MEILAHQYQFTALNNAYLQLIYYLYAIIIVVRRFVGITILLNITIKLVTRIRILASKGSFYGDDDYLGLGHNIAGYCIFLYLLEKIME